jgi:hypothetical protein
MRKFKVKKLTQESIERINQIFKIIEINTGNRRDMKKVNEKLNQYFREHMKIDISAFEEKYPFVTDRDYTEVAIEKATFLACLGIGLSYGKLTDKMHFKLIKSIPFLKFLIDYKFENFGAEIFSKLGLDIEGFDNNGNLRVRKKENMTEEQKKKWKNTMNYLGNNVMKVDPEKINTNTDTENKNLN